jgi:hypothetical protein
MEPIITSSIVLVAAMLTAPKTARPDWEIKDNSQSSEHWNILGSDKTLQDNVLLVTPTKITTLLQPAKTTPLIVTAPASAAQSVTDDKAAYAPASLKEKLYAELIRYLPGATGSDPEIISREEEVVTCIRFIRSLPAGIPLPSLMRNSEGDIGMYWDDGEVYADINIEPKGKLSLFTKVRSSQIESFLENQDIDFIDPAWAFSNLKILVEPRALA